MATEKKSKKNSPEISRDFDVRTFAWLLGRLPAHLPISDAYYGYHRAREEKGVLETLAASERFHMVKWFRAQPNTGDGPYLRSKSNRSAKRAYNRLVNSRSLLWINEALGQDPARVQEAADAAAAEPDYRSRCRIVREYLPWEEVAELASAQLESGKRALWLRRLQVRRQVWFTSRRSGRSGTQSDE
ncbi:MULTISPECIES: hypothetical protein [unclassified Actinobaculum]|uniref:hypothetical protein n=1 Tax=unclassified Actinobaculum TaxID=2609299 RepID=UPI000D528BC9|nr:MULTISPECIES: hypothetical protein [unclassified Actinobaculum]AWE41728.1 hypothetical protein DDD63_01940 [Actinobaculum sp. 313]RTE50361.1 hypothetical protein EKN07_03965 [Actinobaculum sp. 352]